MTAQFLYLNWLHCPATNIREKHSLFHVIGGDIKWNFIHVPEPSYAGSSRVQRKAHKPSWRVRSGRCRCHFSASSSAASFPSRTVAMVPLQLEATVTDRRAALELTDWTGYLTSTTWAAIKSNQIPPTQRKHYVQSWLWMHRSKLSAWCCAWIYCNFIVEFIKLNVNVASHMLNYYYVNTK